MVDPPQALRPTTERAATAPRAASCVAIQAPACRLCAIHWALSFLAGSGDCSVTSAGDARDAAPKQSRVRVLPPAASLQWPLELFSLWAVVSPKASLSQDLKLMANYCSHPMKQIHFEESGDQHLGAQKEDMVHTAAAAQAHGP